MPYTTGGSSAPLEPRRRALLWDWMLGTIDFVTLQSIDEFGDFKVAHRIRRTNEVQSTTILGIHTPSDRASKIRAITSPMLNPPVYDDTGTNTRFVSTTTEKS